MSERDLNGRHIVVTGGTGALGTAVVTRLLEAGATCHVAYLLEEERRAFPYRDQVELSRVDCADQEQVGAFFGGLEALDASIHTVGGFAIAPIARTGLDDFQSLMILNAQTCFLCCREAVRVMRERRTVGGRIVNVGGRPAVSPAGGMVAYSAAKAAVAAITRALAEETRDDGILVNAILPSIIDTPANRRAMPEADHSRWTRLQDVAETIAFLAGPDNVLISGGLVPVYGRA